LSLTVAKVGTSVQVLSSLNPASFGQLITLTARVVPAAGSTAPLDGQTVTFKEGATTLGTGTLNASGLASMSTSSLGAGPHTITAIYDGDASTFNGSAGNLNQLVTMGTTTLIMSTRAVTQLGKFATFIIQVTPRSGSPAGLAGQQVVIRDKGRAIGVATLDANGVAVFRTRRLRIGVHQISAIFPGLGTFEPSESFTIVQRIRKAGRRKL
jgi:hypothetical protein